MFSKLFIFRPKLALVISLVMSLIGAISLVMMPIAEYPQLSPKVITVQAFYPGADAEVIRDTVARPLEQIINGVEDMIYMQSNMGNDGSYRLRVYFKVDADGDMAQVRVNNLVGQALPQLPQEVKAIGVTIKKQSSDMLANIAINSPNGTYDSSYLSNFTEINIIDRLKRVDGMSEATILGQKSYSFRIWLDPIKMKTLKVSTSEVRAALREQNRQAAAGKIGGNPAPNDQSFQYVLKTKGRLNSTEEFENIIVRAAPNSVTIRIKDIGRVELGAKRYEGDGLLNNKDAAVVMLYQLPDANAVATMDLVDKELQKMSKKFPDDIEATIVWRSTDYIKQSINEIFHTLIEAGVLVIIVVYLFLQNFRATIIPAVAIPVSITTTFAIMAMLDMSINTVSMFGLILAIGIVVDDAIIVVENVERIMHEEGKDPIPATIQSMREITGPVVATTLVLLAVFVPAAMLPGITGRMYNQFAVTICASVLVSAVNALTLSPAMCALILKREHSKPIAPLRAFNVILSKMTNGFMGITRAGSKFSVLSLGIFISMVVGLLWFMKNSQTAFVPSEDKSLFIVEMRLPSGSSLERTKPALKKYTEHLKKQAGVQYVVGVTGFSLINAAVLPSSALMLVKLDHWDKRKDPKLHQNALMARTRQYLNQQKDIRAFVFAMPAIRGMGAVDGFSLILEDTLGRSPAELAKVNQSFIQTLNQSPEIALAFSIFNASTPRRFIDIDREKAKTMGVSVGSIFATLNDYLGNAYINDFNIFGRAFQVRMMADKQYRSKESDLNRLYVKSNRGEMVALGTLVKVVPQLGPDTVTIYNLFANAGINGYPAPGYTTGDIINSVEKLAKERLPEGYDIEWSGLTYQEIIAGDTAKYALALSLIFTYLFLVAQYESWLIPTAVMMAVPVALLGGYASMMIMGSAVDIYTQIGLIILLAMATKVAILLVEFGRMQREDKNMSIIEAAAESARVRYRAVLMTAFAFIAGVYPLVVASGAGAAARHSLGYAVFGGMIISTIFGVTMTPSFFALIQKVREFFKGGNVKPIDPNDYKDA